MIRPFPPQKRAPCRSKCPKSLKSIPAASPATGSGAAWAIRASIWKWATRVSWNAPIAIAASCCVTVPDTIIDRTEKRRPSLSDRWLGLSFPRLSRLAAFDPQIRWPAHRGGVGLLQHAVEAAGGYEVRRCAQPSGGDLRRQREDLPQQDLQGIQGASSAAAGRPDPAISASP